MYISLHLIAWRCRNHQHCQGAGDTGRAAPAWRKRRQGMPGLTAIKRNCQWSTKESGDSPWFTSTNDICKGLVSAKALFYGSRCGVAVASGVVRNPRIKAIYHRRASKLCCGAATHIILHELSSPWHTPNSTWIVIMIALNMISILSQNNDCLHVSRDLFVYQNHSYPYIILINIPWSYHHESYHVYYHVISLSKLIIFTMFTIIVSFSKLTRWQTFTSVWKDPHFFSLETNYFDWATFNSHVNLPEALYPTISHYIPLNPTISHSQSFSIVVYFLPISEALGPWAPGSVSAPAAEAPDRPPLGLWCQGSENGSQKNMADRCGSTHWKMVTLWFFMDLSMVFG